ncbi:MAG: hypothetical protein A2W61_00750 [Deltaproteobacteria bacterium RIFCSPLOWO2_01_44_7]|nr:MAG: hypothetical protein A2712_05815 [Deltaproteobacteria bacterium RIFCSPHIGHO2_01_FULL_43_49]OGQ16647.1 MAG: hypothetical protein A3D22_06940 [Deltaproteobacteria bacterium RIFCSPHIGHO2_02_FULL_44_53]OGQ29785.1 MAG: hypothetical protein A3D98_09605 [Deltaproteobacteria bacterium RIFCSPHIGHO2_12_FULL_44_21]OGQ33075.1 MAG: hypothetical protein A2979_03585 [Deltaproteobacteria bacterium RIFCSPLOWO2_01_FULL_45_74]OGQ37936.1 MAG: hypothetical protein A2W61_00750 [Deltaproteobacteria bacterium 
MATSRIIDVKRCLTQGARYLLFATEAMTRKPAKGTWHLGAPKVPGSFWYLLVLVLLYIFFRLPVLLSYAEPISFELHRGNVAIEFLEGLRLPIWDYIAEPYALAPLFNGLLTAPFFKVFGETLFALRLLPFFWHLFSLVAWFYVWRLAFSASQVFWILLLFILAPPKIVHYAIANHGTHFELILWTALSILVLERIITKKWPLFWGGLLLGFVGGFSNNFAYSNLATAVSVLFYMLIRKQKKVIYMAYGVGFLLGWFPALIYNVTSGGRGLEIFQKIYASLATPYFWMLHLRLVFLKEEGGIRGLAVFEGLPGSLGPFLSFGFSIIYLISLLILLRYKWSFFKEKGNRFDVVGFALIYQIVFLSLVVLVRENWAHYYLFPLVPFMGMTIFFASKRVAPFLRVAIMGYCLFLGCLGNILLTDFFRGMGKTLSIKGYSYEEFSDQLAYILGYNFDAFQKKSQILLEGKPLSNKQAFYEGLPNDVFFVRTVGDEKKILEYIQSVEKEFQPILFSKFREASLETE